MARLLLTGEAAEILGTSVDTVRMRVRSGIMQSEKDSDGRVYVWWTMTRQRLNLDQEVSPPRSYSR